MVNQTNKEQGFTLIEVLAATVILALIIIGSLGLFTFAQKASVSNNEKFVAVNLAKASLERLKLAPSDFFDQDDPRFEMDSELVFTGPDYCEAMDQGCLERFKPKINNRDYEVTVYASQSQTKAVGQSYSEKELGLYNIRVEVTLEEANIVSEVEGYINAAEEQAEGEDELTDE